MKRWVISSEAIGLPETEYTYVSSDEILSEKMRGSL